MSNLLNRFSVTLTALVATACSSLAPGSLPSGASIAEARGTFGGPTGEYPLPGGGTRLEFARGSFGRQTYMLDFDPAGRLVTSEQVLTEAKFATITPGLSAGDVRMRLGRPANVFYVPYQKITVWNYRYWPADCVWYQVSIDASQRVTESNYGTDPACDGPGTRQ